jgi:TfoX/Sxy family transcriptional regulator of competence genes
VAYNEALAGRVRAALAGQATIEEKKMFGGLSFMLDEQMCCGVLKDELMVRIEPGSLDQALAQPGVRPFDFTGRPSTGMVYVATAALSSDEMLQAWVRRGIDYVKAHPKAKNQYARRRSRS